MKHPVLLQRKYTVQSLETGDMYAFIHDHRKEVMDCEFLVYP